jgi:putative transposase
MSRLVRLTDAEWSRLEPLLPVVGGRGRPSRPHRMMLEAMLWILRTGAPWRDLPPEYGSWQTVYTRFSRWSQKDVLKRVFEKLAEDRDGEGYMIDGTIVRAHQDAMGAPKKAVNKRLAVLAAVRRRSFTR